LPAHPRSAAIQHPLFRLDEITRRDLGAVIECGGERQRSVGFEVISQRMKYCPLTASPFHLMPPSIAHIRYVAWSTVTPGANAPVENVSTPSEL
jgi:hypothetical protein